MNSSIKNISFIVIARNEEFALEKCLRSIANMPLKNCEIICVDSDSSDGTLDVMKRYSEIFSAQYIVHCEGFLNAAVARNAAIQYATKDYIYFVDGDIELGQDFIREALNRIERGVADVVTGKLHEIQYTPDYLTIVRELDRRKMMTEEKPCLMTGGIFLATRAIIKKVGEWDTEFFRLQDFDYTLRVSRCGKLLQLPQYIGTHHTQEYIDRSWQLYRRGYPVLYGKLLRKNIDRLDFVLPLLRGNRGLATFLLLVFVIILGLLSSVFLPELSSLILLVICSCFLLDFYYSVFVKKFGVTQWFLHNYLEPPNILYGVLMNPKYDIGETKVRLII